MLKAEKEEANMLSKKDTKWQKLGNLAIMPIDVLIERKILDLVGIDVKLIHTYNNSTSPTSSKSSVATFTNWKNPF